jgi:hypothetical protein
MQTVQEEIEAEVMPELEDMNVTESEANQAKKEVVAEHQQVPNEEAAVETIGAPEDRYGDQQPPKKHRQQQVSYSSLRSVLSRRGLYCAIT